MPKLEGEDIVAIIVASGIVLALILIIVFGALGYLS